MGSTPRVIGSLALSVGGMSLAILSACSAPANPGATITVTETVTSSPGAEDLGMSGEAPKEPANPVPLLERVQGCIPEGGTEVGDHDINGNRYASCSFLDNGGTPGTAVTVRTYPGDPRTWDPMPEQLTSDDSNKVIVGDDFVVVITGDWDEYSQNVDPADIADQVGGTLVPSS